MTIRLFLMSAMMIMCVLTLSQVVFACTCELPTASRSIRKKVHDAKKKSSAVFTGEVLEISSQTDGYSVRVSFRVESLWKGPKTNEVLVFTGKGGGDCGYPFVVGKKYLVYALRFEEGFLTTNICQRTQLASMADGDFSVLGKPRNEQNKEKKDL